MKKSKAIHPFLFVIFPVLFIYAYNIEEVLLSDTMLPIAIVLCFTFLILASLTLILKNKIKAAIIVSAFLILFFSYGQIAKIVILHLLIDIFLIHAFLMLIFVVLFSCCVYFVNKSHREFHDLTNILNIAAFSLVLMSLINIGTYNIKSTLLSGNINKKEELQTNNMPLEKTDRLPNIYYIILDRYASTNTLEEIYNFDNSEFIDYLSQKGFYVASQSKANYLGTMHSLASSLNMEYINSLTKIKEFGAKSNSWAPIYALFSNFKVLRFLKVRGYKFRYIGSGHWEKTMRDYLYKNSKRRFPSEFLMTLYGTTMLYPIGAAFDIDKRKMKHIEIVHSFDDIAEIVELEGPTFVLAHIYVPHWPYVFDRNGNFVTRWEERRKSLKEGYIDQLIFTNNKIKMLINKLLSSSEIPPIIIVQADEGPFPQKSRVMEKDEENYNWLTATDEDFRKKFGILNAFYLPNADKSALYPTITPVNSFRLIFSLYFDINLELLPDKSYAFENFHYPYKFFDVSDKVKYN